ncbi:MAG TPA: hypothetical protein VK203_30010 [Nostocaceae cyanobacterium]|nr:hypothetical protein [Nostocaceae cyanobacterium]
MSIEHLKARIKELGKQAADFSKQAVEMRVTNFEQSQLLMRQARDASRRCQVLIAELIRQHAA